MFDRSNKRLILLVGDLKFVARKTLEPRHHLGEDLSVKARVLLRCAPHEMLESIALCKCREVDEVARLGSSKDGKNLVNGEFFASQSRTKRPLLDWKEAKISAEIDLRHIARLTHLESIEAGALPNSTNGKPGVPECPLDDGDDLIDLNG